MKKIIKLMSESVKPCIKLMSIAMVFAMALIALYFIAGVEVPWLIVTNFVLSGIAILLGLTVTVCVVIARYMPDEEDQDLE